MYQIFLSYLNAMKIFAMHWFSQRFNFDCSDEFTINYMFLASCNQVFDLDLEYDFGSECIVCECMS